MGKKTIVVALLVLIIASAATFLGVFYGIGKRKLPENVYVKAAVAADAGPCSEVGR